jgi:hypothetical protein
MYAHSSAMLHLTQLVKVCRSSCVNVCHVHIFAAVLSYSTEDLGEEFLANNTEVV